MISNDTETPSSNPFAVLKYSIVIWLDDWTDWIIIGTLWLLSWLIVFLGPPATFSLYYVAAELRQGRAIGIRGFVQAGKKYFWKSWLWMLISLIVMVVIILNYQFYGRLNQPWTEIVKSAMIFSGILWIIIQFYALPYLIFQVEQSLILAWKNAFLTVLASPFHALVILSLSIVPLLLGAQGLVAILGCVTIQDRIQAFGIHEREEERKCGKAI